MTDVRDPADGAAKVREHEVRFDVLPGTTASVRHLDDQEEWRSVCGMRRDLTTTADEGPARIHSMRIGDSTKHFHKATTEYYYVTEGHGEMELDDETVTITKGDLIVVPPGVRHTSRPLPGEELQILLIVVPSFTADGAPPAHVPDEHFD